MMWGTPPTYRATGRTGPLFSPIIRVQGHVKHGIWVLFRDRILSKNVSRKTFEKSVSQKRPFFQHPAKMCIARPANSEGLPSLGGKGTIFPRASRTACGRIASIGVSKIPGAMVITRMPYSAHSLARGKVMPTTPAFDAA